MASTPVSSWSDSTVFQYKLVRWDHQLLNTHGYQVTAYEQARVQFTRLNKGSREETKTVVTEAYLAEKRKLLVKLLELRAAAGQSMRQDTRIAATAIAASNAAAENLRVAMAKETARSHRKMQRLLVEQGEHLEDIGEVGKMLGADEAGVAPAADEAQADSDDEEQQFVTADPYQLDDSVPPASAADSSTSAVPAAKAPRARAKAKAAPAAEEADITKCPVCDKPVKGKRGLTTHKRHWWPSCSRPGRVSC